MKINKYWWLGILGSIVSGWLTNLAYDKYYEVRREPTFIVNPSVSTIVHRSLIQDQPITVIDKSGNSIHEDVNIATFYFFNKGKEAIEMKDILDTLRINFSKRNKLLDFRILKVSSEHCGIKIAEYDSLNGSWKLDFKILETNDGFTGQIIYAGSTDHQLTMTGSIKGVEANAINSVVEFDLFPFPYFLLVTLIFICLLIYYFKTFQSSEYGIRLTTKYSLIIIKDDVPDVYSKLGFTYAKILVISVGIFVIIFTGSFILSGVLTARWTKEKAKMQIPTSILPDWRFETKH